ncbi:aminopeptidase [Curtanaerobium respiraculi]|uniref:aminopeptidase n=1 Tax=Curtanaerobium respiraculi TaxID=2949669 RepID=UPI0024B37D5C|nr:aminopeptidase [Curtanaerobium respiraculi]
MERKNAWKGYELSDLEAIDELAGRYIEFISENKTERECAAAAVDIARKAGYRSIDEVLEAGERLKPGARVYASLYGKTVMLVQLGTDPLEQGVNILGAHIDSPRLDVKQNPLYESSDFALLDTHYYGGIKKYQWVTLPLAIHGVVAKTDGSVVTVNVGEDPADPVFCVTDLLPHLGGEQMKKAGDKVVEGEALDVLCGSRPLAVEKGDAEHAAEGSIEEMAAKEPVRAAIVSLLQDKYGFDEEDFLSAELEVVPAGRARTCGFDGSMVLGYGQDDRSCAYPSLIAQIEAPADLERTAVCLLVDKEEIGSVGATGMTSLFFENTMAEILELAAQGGPLALRRCLANSNMLSSDVSAGFDPSYASVFEGKNSAYLGRGLVFNKFTGARGKSGSNDANAEYVAKVRGVMEAGGVAYQTAELGAVDAGGGGTIAYILAKYTMNVIDSGVPVLSMHAPWEVTSKADLYEAKKGYAAFIRHAK